MPPCLHSLTGTLERERDGNDTKNKFSFFFFFLGPPGFYAPNVVYSTSPGNSSMSTKTYYSSTRIAKQHRKEMKEYDEASKFEASPWMGMTPHRDFSSSSPGCEAPICLRTTSFPIPCSLTAGSALLPEWKR